MSICRQQKVNEHKLQTSHSFRLINTLILPLGANLLLLIVISFNCLNFMASPSMWIYVWMLLAVLLNWMRQGPSPCATLAPKLPTRYKPSLSSSLKPKNQILPSSKRCSVNWGVSVVSIPKVEVFQTFWRPAMQRIEFRANRLPQPLFNCIFPSQIWSCLPLSQMRGSSLVPSTLSFLYSFSLSMSSPFSLLSCVFPLSLKVCIASSVLLILWQSLQSPMQPQSAKLSHLFFCLFSYTQQQMRASTPIPKQLQKPRSNYFRQVATSRLSRICIISPSQQVLTDECQMSNQHSSAYSHSINLDFSQSIQPAEKEIGDPPHPKHLEKSLPVPMGMIQKVTLVRSKPDWPTNETTQRTVPSPPQTTAVTFPFPLFSTLLCVFRIRSRASPLACTSNRSTK